MNNIFFTKLELKLLEASKNGIFTTSECRVISCACRNINMPDFEDEVGEMGKMTLDNLLYPTLK